ncbi:hypothetical protein HME9302_00900 [Alteripontixanthobacter maritimus]|uniref:DUF11 domain-containing protein n=1 Tax=Alteripontixanthobacter maritimus TaxID=2161824 RepID=A0A369QBT6_9SPHN|nr:hypothetical protein [Alteripontixanthobacter maritimus]RDC59708.1 hypothetical protein HME9302_00900 [Alteripontixanthobacter maritimus]
MHNKFISVFAAAAFAIGAFSAPATAQDKPVTLAGDVMKEQITLDDNGGDRIEMVAPDVVIPGDRLLFATSYTNTSGEAIEDFVVTNPLPAAVRLSEGSDADLVVSVDGGETWGKLNDLRVESEGGVSRDAAEIDVTHVRWTLASIAPGESGRLEYYAIVR